MHARHVSCNLSDPLRLKLCALTVPTQGTMSPSPLEQTEIAMNKRTNLFLNYKLHCGLYRIVEEDPEVELPEALAELAHAETPIAVGIAFSKHGSEVTLERLARHPFHQVCRRCTPRLGLFSDTVVTILLKHPGALDDVDQNWNEDAVLDKSIVL